jgi:hypothetical protein
MAQQSEFSGLFERKAKPGKGITSGRQLRREMRKWMKQNHDDYDNSTELASAAAQVFNTYGNGYGKDEVPEEIFELADDVDQLFPEDRQYQ